MIVGNNCLPNYLRPWEDNRWIPVGAVFPDEVSIGGRNGIDKHCNASGVPNPGGFYYTFGLDPGDGYRSPFKPIVFCGIDALLRDDHKDIRPFSPNSRLVKDGNSRLPVGYGGGFRSSTSTAIGEDLARARELDDTCVQRSGPFMERLCTCLNRGLIELGEANPTEDMKDGGAGGDGTAIAESGKGYGVTVQLDAIPNADPTMSQNVRINNESQEQTYRRMREDGVAVAAAIARREGVPFNEIGTFIGDGRLVFTDREASDPGERVPIDLPLDRLFGRPQKEFDIQRIEPIRRHLTLPRGISLEAVLERVLRLEGVACKSWLTNRADRSVTGRIALQSCLGPYQLPVADCYIHAHSCLDTVGTAKHSAARPHWGLATGGALARMTLTEALLSLASVYNSGRQNTAYENNWFSAAKSPGIGAIIDDAAIALDEAAEIIGTRQLGGKDSSSGKNPAHHPLYGIVDVLWPVVMVITMQAQMQDMRRYVTPIIEGDCDALVYVDLSPDSKPLGATCLAQVYGQTGDDWADADMTKVRDAFDLLQQLHRDELMLAYHDVSDGGLIVALLEMAFTSGVGLDISTSGHFGWLRHYLSETPGALVGCRTEDVVRVTDIFQDAGVHASYVADVRHERKPNIYVDHNSRIQLDAEMTDLRHQWMETSFRLDQHDPKRNIEVLRQEEAVVPATLQQPKYFLPFRPEPPRGKKTLFGERPVVAIFRAPGSNGEREAAAMFYEAGFAPLDVITTDLKDGKPVFENAQVVFKVGGFSYQDEPFESGVGWISSIEENAIAKRIYDEFFFERQDTLSLSVCNGAQAALLRGVVPDQSLVLGARPRFLSNASGYFESRYVTVRVENSPAVMFQGMHDMVWGIIVAHGEGRLYCHDQAILDWIRANDLVTVSYVDPRNSEPTEIYPYNPNGSPFGIAGLCTPDGRHLAMMPHPERLFQPWQFPWLPPQWKKLEVSPWLKMAQNAYEWCLENRT